MSDTEKKRKRENDEKRDFLEPTELKVLRKHLHSYGVKVSPDISKIFLNRIETVIDMSAARTNILEQVIKMVQKIPATDLPIHKFLRQAFSGDKAKAEIEYFGNLVRAARDHSVMLLDGLTGETTLMHMQKTSRLVDQCVRVELGLEHFHQILSAINNMLKDRKEEAEEYEDLSMSIIRDVLAIIDHSSTKSKFNDMDIEKWRDGHMKGILRMHSDRGCDFDAKKIQKCLKTDQMHLKDQLHSEFKLLMLSTAQTKKAEDNFQAIIDTGDFKLWTLIHDSESDLELALKYTALLKSKRYAPYFEELRTLHVPIAGNEAKDARECVFGDKSDDEEFASPPKQEEHESGDEVLERKDASYVEEIKQKLTAVWRLRFKAKVFEILEIQESQYELDGNTEKEPLKSIAETLEDFLIDEEWENIVQSIVKEAIEMYRVFGPRCLTTVCGVMRDLLKAICTEDPKNANFSLECEDDMEIGDNEKDSDDKNVWTTTKKIKNTILSFDNDTMDEQAMLQLECTALFRDISRKKIVVNRRSKTGALSEQVLNTVKTLQAIAIQILWEYENFTNAEQGIEVKATPETTVKEATQETIVKEANTETTVEEATPVILPPVKVITPTTTVTEVTTEVGTPEHTIKMFLTYMPLFCEIMNCDTEPEQISFDLLQKNIHDTTTAEFMRELENVMRKVNEREKVLKRCALVIEKLQAHSSMKNSTFKVKNIPMCMDVDEAVRMFMIESIDHFRVMENPDITILESWTVDMEQWMTPSVVHKPHISKICGKDLQKVYDLIPNKKLLSAGLSVHRPHKAINKPMLLVEYIIDETKTLWAGILPNEKRVAFEANNVVMQMNEKVISKANALMYLGSKISLRECTTTMKPLIDEVQAITNKLLLCDYKFGGVSKEENEKIIEEERRKKSITNTTKKALHAMRDDMKIVESLYKYIEAKTIYTPANFDEIMEVLHKRCGGRRIDLDLYMRLFSSCVPT